MYAAKRDALEQAVNTLTEALSEAKDAHAHMDRAAQYDGTVAAPDEDGGRRLSAKTQRDNEAQVAAAHHAKAVEAAQTALSHLAEAAAD